MYSDSQPALWSGSWLILTLEKKLDPQEKPGLDPNKKPVDRTQDLEEKKESYQNTWIRIVNNAPRETRKKLQL